MDQYTVFYSLTFSFGASFSDSKTDFICTKNIGKRYVGRATLVGPRWPLASAIPSTLLVGPLLAVRPETFSGKPYLVKRWIPAHNSCIGIRFFF